MAERGYTMPEILIVVSLIGILTSAAVPFTANTLDRQRTAAAARYVSGRLMHARFEAVARSRFVAVQFALRPDGYRMRTFVDGNGDGVLTRDINRGVDVPITPEVRLADLFSGVTFGICTGVTSIVAGDPFNAADPIQIGSSALLSFNPNGSSTGGTVYLRGRQLNQSAVRVLGATARSRIFNFDFGRTKWNAQ